MEPPTNQQTDSGIWLHDKDGMTSLRADLLVAQVRQVKKWMADAALVGNFERVAECRRQLDAINEESRRLNRIRQQKIVGWRGPKPPMEALNG